MSNNFKIALVSTLFFFGVDAYAQIDPVQIIENLADKAADDTAEDLAYKTNRTEGMVSEGAVDDSGDNLYKLDGSAEETSHNLARYGVAAKKFAKDYNIPGADDIPTTKLPPQLYYVDNMQLYELNPITHMYRRNYDLPPNSTINVPTTPPITKLRNAPEQ